MVTRRALEVLCSQRHHWPAPLHCGDHERPRAPGDAARTGVPAWLDEDFEGHVVLKPEHGQWYALLLEFDITGCGDTRAAAVQDSFALLGAYLHAYFEEGSSFADAVRPVPRRLRARIAVESILGRPLRSLAPRLALANESTYALPPGLLRFAH